MADVTTTTAQDLHKDWAPHKNLQWQGAVVRDNALALLLRGKRPMLHLLGGSCDERYGWSREGSKGWLFIDPGTAIDAFWVQGADRTLWFCETCCVIRANR